MSFETGDLPQGAQANESGRAALSEDYLQLAKADTASKIDSDCSTCSDSGASDNVSAANMPDIEQMKDMYPVIGPSLERYQALVNGGDAAAYLEAQPDFLKNVTDSDTSFSELETSITQRLEEMGPDAIGFKRGFNATHEAFNQAWEDLLAEKQLEIGQKASQNQIPISEAAEGHPEVQKTAKAAEDFFKDNFETQMKLTSMQAELTNSYQQRLFAREMYGDTLKYGARAADGDRRMEMTLEKQGIDMEVTVLYNDGVPSVFEYIKDQ